MTLATRCPRCATVFRLVPEQLLLAQGWARCGHCQAAFDADAAKFDVLPPALPADTPPPVTTSVSAAAADVTALPQQLTRPLRDVASAADGDSVLISAESWSESTLVAPTLMPADLVGDSVRAQRLEPVFDAAVSHSGDIAPASPSTTPDAATALDAALATDPSEAADAAAEPRFLRQARARERWQSPRLRALLGVAVLLLTLLLLGQSLYWWRGRLAARWPQTRPLLQALCRPLHCAVQAPALPQLLELESSGLTPDGSDALLLRAHLRNKGNSAIAYPALELTLLGAPSQVLVRRVLLPQDYLPSRAQADALQRQLAVGLPAHAELDVALVLKTLGVNASGYTLLAFYP